MKLASSLLFLGLVLAGLSYSIASLSHRAALAPPEAASLLAPYPFAIPPPDLGEPDVADCKRRLAFDSHDGMTRAILAGLYYRQARVTNDPACYMLAEQMAQQSLDDIPFPNKGALATLARVSEAKHDFRQALVLADRLLKFAASTEAREVQIVSNLGLGRVAEARTYADKLVEEFPSTNTFTYLALVQEAMGQDAEVEETYRHALKLEEANDALGSSWTRSMLGRFFFRRGHLDEALKVCAESIRVYPKSPMAIGQLADVETALGRYDDAEAHYGAAYELCPQPIFLMGKAHVRRLRGDSASADMYIGKAEQWLRKDLVGSPLGHGRELAQLLLDRGHDGDAIEAVAIMRKDVDNRRDWQSLETYAWALEATGATTEADTVLREALATGVRDANLEYLAAVAAETLQRKDDAARDLHQAFDINPHFDNAALATQLLASLH